MKRHEFTKEEIKIIIHEYVDNKRSGNFLGNKFNVTKKVIYRVLRENGIKIRNFSECQRKFQVNENYFVQEDSIMAYILGFIAADGCITDDNKLIINLSSVDHDFLENINKILNNAREVKKTINNKGFQISSLLCCSLKIKQDLNKYNIVPRKTGKNVYPYQLSDDFKIDWIRGFFDGDGCIYKGSNQLCFELICANKKVLEEIVNFLYEHYSIPKINVNNKTDTLYRIRYSTNSSKQLFNILYYPDVKLFLPRKYEKYKSYMI